MLNGTAIANNSNVDVDAIGEGDDAALFYHTDKQLTAVINPTKLESGIIPMEL